MIANVVKVNVAFTERASDIVNTHVPVPAHAPDQPVKDDPDAGDAVSVTIVSTA